MGKVVSINISEKKGTVKTAINQGLFLENMGLEDDAHMGAGERQVSLLALESINKMKALGNDWLKFGDFAENITTEGLVLHQLKLGTRLKIGKTVHEVSKIGKTCHNNCDIKKRIGQCIMPSEGIFTRVLLGGMVFVGDEITVME